MESGLMPTFNYTFTVNTPLADVANFYCDTSALKTLSPGPVQIHPANPIGEGLISEFTLWLGPIPVRWWAVHSNVSKNGSFIAIVLVFVYTAYRRFVTLKAWPTI